MISRTLQTLTAAPATLVSLTGIRIAGFSLVTVDASAAAPPVPAATLPAAAALVTPVALQPLPATV